MKLFEMTDYNKLKRYCDTYYMNYHENISACNKVLTEIPGVTQVRKR